jgi:hypothetical protein
LNPSDLLVQLLQRMDLEIDGVDLVTADEITGWPQEALACLIIQRVLLPVPPATTATCDSCSDNHAEEVQVVESQSQSAPRYYIACPQNGRVQLEPERLRCWRIDGSGLAQVVSRLLNCQDQCRETVRGRLWSLGVAKLRGKTRDVFLVRGLGWNDAELVLSPHYSLLSSNSSIVIGLTAPVTSARRVMPVVPLQQVLSLTRSAFMLDRRKLVSLQNSDIRMLAGNKALS